MDVCGYAFRVEMQMRGRRPSQQTTKRNIKQASAKKRDHGEPWLNLADIGQEGRHCHLRRRPGGAWRRLDLANPCHARLADGHGPAWQSMAGTRESHIIRVLILV
jgi:hypothetical protein